MQEIWKPVIGWEDLYEVSNLGNVRSLDRFVNVGRYQKFCKGQVLKPTFHKSNYYIVTLRNSGIQKVSKVHQLVMNAFNPKPNNQKLEINHIDGDTKNNRLDNLEWCTHQENLQHASKHHLLSTYKPINQYDLKGNFIKRWNSMNEARDFYDYGINSIRNACKRKSGIHGDYIWRYADK